MQNSQNPAVKRLMREARELAADPNPDFSAAPLPSDIMEWHFEVRGPAGTPFEGGLYHGRIMLPPEYPFKPPSIMLLTPSGRFEVGKKICLSISAHHPEDWQPAWGIRTMITALVAFFPTPADGALGALQWRPDERRKLALESQTWRCPCCGPIAELVEGGADERVLADGEAASAAFDAPVLPWDEGRAAAPAAAPAPATAELAAVELSVLSSGPAIFDSSPPSKALRVAGTPAAADTPPQPRWDLP